MIISIHCGEDSYHNPQGLQTNNPGGEWFSANFSGHESVARVAGNNNNVEFYTASKGEGRETLFRKAVTQVGRLFEGGTDLIVAPAKWLNHMQENW